MSVTERRGESDSVSVSEELPTVVKPPRNYAPVLSRALIRQVCEDFEVEELPAYAPSGDGEHLMLWIEKRDIPTSEVVSRLVRNLDVSVRDIGVAGQKDRRAVTRQFVSVPRTCERRLQNVSDDRFTILSASAHGNKLRTGHLLGNRFRIVLRPTAEDFFADADVLRVQERLAVLECDGFPGYFGSQRFGHDGRTAIEGLQLLRGELKMSHWKPRQRRFMKKMVASAAQSAVFNLVLANRVKEGTWAKPRSGDVVCSRTGRRPFLFDDRGDLAAQELVPMGPMPGPKMTQATGDVLAAENDALRRLEVPDESFAKYPRITSGTRRRNVDFPSNTSARKTPDGSIELKFDLSSGSFATVLLSEIAELQQPTPLSAKRD